MDAEHLPACGAYALPFASNACHLTPRHETSGEGAVGAMGGETMSARTDVLADGPHRLLIETLGEGFRQGIWGVYDDTLAVARPWGFAPGAVQTPVWIWQGDADTAALAQELAGKLPHCSFTLLPGEGHFLLFTHRRAMLQMLVQASAQ
jgi:hypothetical protein